MQTVKVDRDADRVALLSLIRNDRPLTSQQAAKAEVEIRRIAQMSLLGEDALLSAVHVAVMLDCSLRVVALLRKAHKLPKAVRFGDLVRWRLCDLEDWVWFGLSFDERLTCRAMVFTGQVPRLPDDVLLSIEHLALVFGCSVRTVAKVVKSGRLPPAVRKDGRVYWRVFDMRLWIVGLCKG